MFNDNRNTENLPHFALFLLSNKKVLHFCKTCLNTYRLAVQVKNKSCQITLLKMVFCCLFFFSHLGKN